jgi:hypothetical protein
MQQHQQQEQQQEQQQQQQQQEGRGRRGEQVGRREGRSLDLSKSINSTFY